MNGFKMGASVRLIDCNFIRSVKVRFVTNRVYRYRSKRACRLISTCRDSTISHDNKEVDNLSRHLDCEIVKSQVLWNFLEANCGLMAVRYYNCKMARH